MISFSAEFPIDDKNSVADVIRVACKWLAGSDRYGLTESDLLPLCESPGNQLLKNSHSVRTAYATTDHDEIAGMQFVTTDDEGLVWRSSLVTLKTYEEHVVSLQVSCEALSTAKYLPSPKKPYFIKLALAELGGGMDGGVPVANRPFLLASGQAPIAAALMLGTAKNKLPIVYVSSSFEGKYLVDSDLLANKLSGLAHVVVEPDRQFSLQLKKYADSHNVYGGTIGVYWPESSARSCYYLSDEVKDGNALIKLITRDVSTALSHRRLRSNCTWAHLQEVFAKNQVDILTAEGSAELNAWTHQYDLASREKLAQAELEILRLQAELRRYTKGSKGDKGALINLGNEQDLYEREILEIAISALRGAIASASADSRRSHVLDDLIRANPSNNTITQMEDEVKRIFRSYTTMDHSTRSSLLKLGFTISEEGKHFKIVFQGEGRYTFAVPKTSSDVRAGLNMASDISKRLF